MKWYKVLTQKIDNKEIEEGEIEWFRKYNRTLIDLFIGASGGALDLDFELLNQNKYRLQIVREILVSISAVFRSIEMNLSKEMFGKIGGYDFGIYANWENPIPCGRIAREIDQLLILIK